MVSHGSGMAASSTPNTAPPSGGTFEDQVASEPASDEEEEEDPSGAASAAALKERVKQLERQLRAEQGERLREHRAAEDARRKLQLLQNQMQRMSTSRLPLADGLAAAAAAPTAASTPASAASSELAARRPTGVDVAFAGLEPDAADDASDLP